MIIRNIKIFSQNIYKNTLLTNIILEAHKDFNIIFIQELPWFFIYSIPSSIIGCLNTNNFSFSFLLFFYIDFIFLLDNEEACDTTVTWQVTWCDIIDLKHGGRIWKIMLGHMYTTWWPWVRNEIDMRM